MARQNKGENGDAGDDREGIEEEMLKPRDEGGGEAVDQGKKRWSC